MFALISVICIFIACFSLIKPEKMPFGREGQHVKMFSIYLTLGILAGILANNKVSDQKSDSTIISDDEKNNNSTSQSKSNAPSSQENLAIAESTAIKDPQGNSAYKEEKQGQTHEVTLSKIERFNDAFAVINYIENLKYEKKPSLIPSHWSKTKGEKNKTLFHAGYNFILSESGKSNQESQLSITMSSSTSVGVVNGTTFWATLVEKSKRKQNRKIYMDELSEFLKFLEIQEKNEIMDLIKKKDRVEKEYPWGKVEYTKEVKPKEGDFPEEEEHVFTITANKHQVKLDEKEFAARQAIEEKAAQIEKNEDKKIEDLKDSVSSNMRKIESVCKEAIKRELLFPSKADFSIFGFVDGYRILNYSKKIVKVDGNFESMNGLGLMIPSKFFCTVDMNDISVKQVKVSIGE